MEDKKIIMWRFVTIIAKTPLLVLLLLLFFFFSKQLTNLSNYSFWMTIMKSLRLKTFFKGSFQLSWSVTILTNTPEIFPQHLFKICVMTSPAKHKKTKTTQEQIQSHLKKVAVSRVPVVSNEAIQVAFKLCRDQSIVKIRPAPQNSEGTPSEAGASPTILKISWNKWRCKNLTRSWLLSSTPKS